jgi:hypothetical protein
VCHNITKRKKIFVEILVEIDGKRQMMEESLLDKTEGVLDNDNEHTTWEEWRLDGVIVKRGAHVTLKRNVLAEGIAAMLK